MKTKDKIGLLLSSHNGCLWMTNLIIGSYNLYVYWGIGLDRYLTSLGGLI